MIYTTIREFFDETYSLNISADDVIDYFNDNSCYGQTVIDGLPFEAKCALHIMIEASEYFQQNHKKEFRQLIENRGYRPNF